eukprot:13966402-Alexandrium_andersonii.AAC.1
MAMLLAMATLMAMMTAKAILASMAMAMAKAMATCFPERSATTLSQIQEEGKPELQEELRSHLLQGGPRYTGPS